MRGLLLIIGLLLAPTLAHAQSTVLSGAPWTQNRAPMYATQGSQQAVIADSGPAGGGAAGLGLSELLLQAQGTGTPPFSGQGSGVLGTNLCDYDAPITNPTGYHYLCLSPNAQGGGLITYGAAGSASPLPLNFNINGTISQIGGGISGITVGTTTVGSGVTQQILYDNAGILGEIAKCNSGVYQTGSTGIPSCSATLPTGITAPSLIVTTAFTATGLVTNADLVNASVTVSGTTCTLGSTCSPAAAVTVGTTTISSGVTNQLLYDNAGVLGEVTKANSSVLITSGAGAPSWATTLPSGLTAPSFTVTTAFTATGLVTLADVATQATNTVLGNATAGTASPTALAVGTCSTAASALIWTTNTGFGCNTSITANAVPAANLTGTTLAAGVVTSSLTTVGTIGTGVWQGTVVGPTYGGTGINNGSFTITLAGSLVTSGAFNTTLTITAATNSTLPSGTHTLAGLDVAQSWTAVQTFTNSDIKLLGSSTGATTFTSANAGASNFTITFPGATDTMAGLNATDQTLAGGANVTAFSIGTVTSGTTTIDCGKSPLQFLTNGGAFTLAAPANDGSCIVETINNGSAGTITFSGFTDGTNVGDALTTTNTNKFFIFITRINGTSGHSVSARQ